VVAGWTLRRRGRWSRRRRRVARAGSSGSCLPSHWPCRSRLGFRRRPGSVLVRQSPLTDQEKSATVEDLLTARSGVFAMQGAILGSQTVLRSLRDTGSLDAARDQLAPWDERQRLVRKATYDELEHRYRAQ
jgi:hypothetical protein